jgi:alpha-ketoglutaric semialdehyde dehydrogenase
MTTKVSSIIGGRSTGGGRSGSVTIENPARLDEVVSEALLGDAETLLEACRVARAAQPEWAAVPAPVRGRAVQQIGRLVEENR